MILSAGLYGILNGDGTFRHLLLVANTAIVKDGRALPVTNTAQPAFNPATHKVVHGGWAVNAEDVTPMWEVVALTQDELDELSSHASVTQILGLADDMINGVGTATQRQVRVEQSCGRLVKRLAKTGIIP
jgi:hypothetical protein